MLGMPSSLELVFLAIGIETSMIAPAALTTNSPKTSGKIMDLPTSFGNVGIEDQGVKEVSDGHCENDRT